MCRAQNPIVWIALAVFFMVPMSVAAGTLDTFESIADAPANLNLPTAATVGDDIYLVSGWDLSTGWSQNMYRYSIPDDAWSTDTPEGDPLPAIPTPRTEACNTNFIEEAGLFCVVGGAEGNGMSYIGPTDAVECYDPDTNAWSALESLPQAVTGAYCAVRDGVIYVTGGYTGSAYNTALYWLDTTAGSPTWTTAPSARPLSAAFGGGAITRDPTLTGKAQAGEYRFSQFMGNSASSTHWGLDSGDWSTAADKEQRGYVCTIPDGDFNTLFIGGGDFATSPPYTTYDSVIGYNALDDTWETAGATLPLSNGAMACTQDDEGNVYLFCGYSTDDDKDLKLGVRFQACRLNMEPQERTVWPGSYLYLTQTAMCATWVSMAFAFYRQGSTMPEPVEPADVEVADNGTARIRLSFDTSFTGSARLRARLAGTGRVGIADFMVADEPPDEEKKLFTEDFDTFRIGLRVNWDEHRWNPDEEGPLRFRPRIQFKDGSGTLMEAEDPDEAAAGQLWAPLYPIETGTFTYTWDAYFEDGDGLSLALYDEVADTLSHGLFVHMLEGGVQIETPDAKAETDYNVALTTGQWYTFSLTVDLDAGTATLAVDDTATDCTAVSVPFGAGAPVQALGFVLPDGLVGGTTLLDNIEVYGFEEPPIGDDDDTDIADDDTGPGDDDDDSAAGGDDDDDNDDNDDGGCGC